MNTEDAARIIRQYNKQLSNGEATINKDTMKVAEALTVQREHHPWYAEVEAAYKERGVHRGRPPGPTDWAFATWVRTRHADHLTARRVLQLLGAHRTAVNYLNRVQVIPTSERQVRPLYKLTSSGRGHAVAAVWTSAVKIAGGGQPTHQDVAKAVREWWKANVPASQSRAETKQKRAAKLRRKIEQEIDKLLDEYHAEVEAGDIAKLIVEKIKAHRKIRAVS